MSRIPLLALLAVVATTLYVVPPVADDLFGYYDGRIAAGKVGVCHYDRSYAAVDEWGNSYTVYVYKCQRVFTLWEVRRVLYCRGPVGLALGAMGKVRVFDVAVVNGTVEVADWALYNMFNITAFGERWPPSATPAAAAALQVDLYEWCRVGP